MKLEWLNTTERESLDMLYAEAANSPGVAKAKEKALAALKIERREGEGYLRAWVRAMAERNGIPLEDGRPCLEIGHAVEASAELSRWVFWLA